MFVLTYIWSYALFSQGPGGRPLIEQNDNGQIVMNIAEMIDPTYQRRHSHMPTDRPTSQSKYLSSLFRVYM